MDDRLVGIILDLSLKHEPEGRTIDLVKSQLIEFLTLNPDVQLYLYEPTDVQVLSENGEKIARVANHTFTGHSFDLLYAGKQTLFLISGYDAEVPKWVVYITDRTYDIQNRIIKKLYELNQRYDFNCSFLVAGINCSPVEDERFNTINLLSTELASRMKEIIYGR